jgi:hypothetical protein
MNTVLNVLAVVLVGAAICIIVMNYACVMTSYRNRRRGIDRHHSTVPFVAQILLALADRVSSITPAPVLPWPCLLGLALVDISLWLLVGALFRYIFHRR